MIPVRMESSRLPNKPLKLIADIPMILHVWERCKLAKNLDEVYVVTDSQVLKNLIEEHGGKVIMTSVDHQTGTDRLAEASLNIDCDVIVNIQGDEALVHPGHIDQVCEVFLNNCSYDVAILVTPFSKKNSPSDIKVVLNKNDEVMYLSRSDIPSDARTPNPSMLKAYHVVPFRKSFLLEYSKMEKTKLEKIEYNEYLRILENGFKIKAIHVDSSDVSVDTESDLEYVRSKMKNDEVFKLYRAKYREKKYTI